MKHFLSTILLALLLTTSAHAAIKGAPFIPESDARFDALEGNPTVNAAEGLHVKQIATATYDFAVDGGTSTAHVLRTSLPANATIVRSYAIVSTAIASVGGGTLAFSCQNAGNIMAATALSTYAPAPVAVDGAATGASTAFKNITAACTINATIAVAPITAGKVTAYVEYVLR